MKVKQATGASITVEDLYKDNFLRITEFGAKPQESPVINTKAINDAINKAHGAGGGTVVIPKGEFKIYTVRLQSNVNIYIEKGAVLQASKTDIKKSYQKQVGEGGNYDEPEVNIYAGLQDHGHTYFANSLIYGENLENIMIYGEGLINGSRIDEETGYLEYVLQGGDPFDNPMRNEKGHIGEWFGNKGIALVRCKNIVFKDFNMVIGGHFAIIAEGVTNLLAENILVDTTRDAFDIDCCQNVTVKNSSFNSLTDDALVVKASYGAGLFMPVYNVLIEDCKVSGYDAGSVYAGKYSKDKLIATDRCGPTGRVKLGTESTCGYDLVTIKRVAFNRSRGFALEAVDVSDLSNIIFTDCTMDNVSSSPIFIRAGERGRFPVTGNSEKEVVNAEEGNVRLDNANWVLPNTDKYQSYPAKRYTPSYQKNQKVSVDGKSYFNIVNQQEPTKINMANVSEIDGKYYEVVYEEATKTYVPNLKKEIPKEKLCLYANAVGKEQMPRVYNIEISNLKVTNADPRYPITLMGLTDSPLQNIVIENIDIEYRGGLSMEHAVEQRQLNTNWKYSQFQTKSSIQTLPWLVNTFFLKAEGLLPRVDWNEEKGEWVENPYNVPEMPDVYPEPSNWGILPAYGFYARHVEGLKLSNVKLHFKVEDKRHAIVLDDAKEVVINNLDAPTAKDIETLAKVTHHFKRPTNKEYVIGESYFTTKVKDIKVDDSLTIKEVVVNAPAPGTPRDASYDFPTVPIPENGYHYHVDTKDYPLPQSVFRPFLTVKGEQIVKVGEEMILELNVRHPAGQVTMEETDGFIYNETVTQKDFLVEGVKNRVKLSLENIPKSAVFEEETNCFRWQPTAKEIGKYELVAFLDDGVIIEREKVSIEVIGCE